MARTRLFLSYSHADREWKERVSKQLGTLEREGLLELWSDDRITAGSDWQAGIDEAIGTARIALLLVSADFLISDFIQDEEVPRILDRHQDDGMLILPLIVRPCPWRRSSWLAKRQARPRDGEPLASFTENQAELALAELAEEIAGLLETARESERMERMRTPMSETAESKPANQAGSFRIEPAYEVAVQAARQRIDAFCNSRGATGAPDRTSMRTLIQMAIDEGAPLYNAGSSAACAAIYAHAAQRLIEAMRARSSGRVRPDDPELARAHLLFAPMAYFMATPVAADDLAWALRAQFDAVLAKPRSSKADSTTDG